MKWWKNWKIWGLKRSGHVLHVMIWSTSRLRAGCRVIPAGRELEVHDTMAPVPSPKKRNTLVLAAFLWNGIDHLQEIFQQICATLWLLGFSCNILGHARKSQVSRCGAVLILETRGIYPLEMSKVSVIPAITPVAPFWSGCFCWPDGCCAHSDGYVEGR